MIKARSLFETKTFWGALAGLLIAAGPIAVTCGNAHRWPTAKEGMNITTALYTFAWALVGRAAMSPVYTPDGIPGPNKSDLQSPPHED